MRYPERRGYDFAGSAADDPETDLHVRLTTWRSRSSAVDISVQMDYEMEQTEAYRTTQSDNRAISYYNPRRSFETSEVMRRKLQAGRTADRHAIDQQTTRQSGFVVRMGYKAVQRWIT